jgi:hypothetical protein
MVEGMTKEQFFNVYRQLILDNCLWASDNAKLSTFLFEVVKTLEGDNNSKWTPAGQELSQKAWQSIGGNGKVSKKKLQELLD